MNDTRLARRYARAVFTVSAREGDDAITRRGAWLGEMRELLDASPTLDNVFKSPIFSVTEKKKVLGDVMDKLGCDATTRNFCFLLADKERLPWFRSVVDAYTKLLDDARGIVRGKLTTAVPLNQARQEAVKQELEQKAGATLELAFDVDPAILGGVVLKVGDRILDSSLRAQLEILRSTLKRGN